MIFSELSLLYVEDEIIVAIETSEILREMGFRDVHVAHNLMTADRMASEKRIDLAILDVNLGNGERTIDLGVRLARLGSTVIFASGYNQSELSDRIQGFDFLEKPFSLADIETLLTEITQRRRGVDAAE